MGQILWHTFINSGQLQVKHMPIPIRVVTQNTERMTINHSNLHNSTFHIHYIKNTLLPALVLSVALDANCGMDVVWYCPIWM